jgi:hypothetical protein
MTTQPTRLFTLRLWQAAQADDPSALEWRGKVQALPEGEAYYFREWTGLIERLETMLNPATMPPTPHSQEVTMSVENTRGTMPHYFSSEHGDAA